MYCIRMKNAFRPVRAIHTSIIVSRVIARAHGTTSGRVEDRKTKNNERACTADRRRVRLIGVCARALVSADDVYTVLAGENFQRTSLGETTEQRTPSPVVTEISSAIPRCPLSWRTSSSSWEMMRCSKFIVVKCVKLKHFP